MSQIFVISFFAATVRRERRRSSTNCWRRPARSIIRPASTTARASATSTRKRSTTSTRSKPSWSISTTAASIFKLIDTPGYPDFIGQTIGAMRAVETAAIVINAHSGIEVNTRRVFREAGKAGLGRMIVSARWTRDNIDFAGLLESIKSMFGTGLHSAQRAAGHRRRFPRRSQHAQPAGRRPGAADRPGRESATALIESIIEVDEEVTGKYFEGAAAQGGDLPGWRARRWPKGT